MRELKDCGYKGNNIKGGSYACIRYADFFMSKILIKQFAISTDNLAVGFCCCCIFKLIKIYEFVCELKN